MNQRSNKWDNVAFYSGIGSALGYASLEWEIGLSESS